MAGTVPLFMKIDGLLVQIAEEQAQKLRDTQPFTHMVTAIDVLLTPEEQDARKEEERAARAKDAARKEAQAAKEEQKQELLKRIGLTEDELKIIL